MGANSLYPHAKTLATPIGDYERNPLLKGQSARMVFMQAMCGMRTPEKDSWVYLVKCVIHVPGELHGRFDWTPTCRMRVPEESRSEYSNELWIRCSGTVEEAAKLVHCLGEQPDVPFLVDYRLLCVQLGLRITKVHAIYSSRVASCMGQCVEEMAEERAQAYARYGSRSSRSHETVGTGRCARERAVTATAEYTRQPNSSSKLSVGTGS